MDILLEKEAVFVYRPTIRLYEPMNWPTFRKLERDLQKEYIQWLREEFDFRTSLSVKLFGVCDETLRRYLSEIGMPAGRGKIKRDPDKTNAFSEWLRKNNWEGGKRVENKELLSNHFGKEVPTVDTSSKPSVYKIGNGSRVELFTKTRPNAILGSLNIECTVDDLYVILRILFSHDHKRIVVSWNSNVINLVSTVDELYSSLKPICKDARMMFSVSWNSDVEEENDVE